MPLIPVGVDRPLIRRPIVTLSLIGINVAVYVVVNLNPDITESVQLRFSSIPGYDSLLTVFTQMFLHDGFWHLFGNMIFFLVPGLKMEDALGHWKFLLFYLGCGLAAQAGHTLLSGAVPIPSLGASGAIAGALGGFMVLYPHNRIKFFVVFWFGVLFYGIWFLRAWIYLTFWFLSEIATMLYFRGMSLESGVAFGAHIGGFAAGAIWAWAFYGWNRGPDLDDAVDARAPIPVIVAPGMRQEEGRQP